MPSTTPGSASCCPASRTPSPISPSSITRSCTCWRAPRSRASRISPARRSISPAAPFERLGDGDALHFLAVPLTPALAQAYVPARLTNDDYPRLVAADAPVDTVAVGAALMVAPLQPRSERYANVASFVDAFFTQFPRLQET